ncbi:MAG: hypothetical protein ABJC24_10560, partial [Chloroflexota bacterium]
MATKRKAPNGGSDQSDEAKQARLEALKKWQAETPLDEQARTKTDQVLKILATGRRLTEKQMKEMLALQLERRAILRANEEAEAFQKEILDRIDNRLLKFGVGKRELPRPDEPPESYA